MEKIEEFFLDILRKIKLNKLADIYISHKEGMRYIIFGILTTIVNIIVSFISYYIFCKLEWDIEVSVNISTILAIIAAWIFAYITNKIYVFKSKTDSAKELIKEIFSFIGCRLISAVLEVWMMNVFVIKLLIDYGLSKIIVSVLVIILNYFFSKLFIFKGEKVEK